MAETSRKAIIVLSEARSGSNWLASLMQANRGWGNCREWLNPAVHKLPQMKRLSPAPLMALIAKSAQSPATGVLGLKVFTHHLTRFHGLYGFDPLAQLTQGRETLYLRLERRDRVAQAVSLEIARQTGAWKSTSAAKSDPVYDFGRILRAYIKIGASYAFWDSYCELRSLRQELFVYEDLAEDPGPWLAACAAFTGRPLRQAAAKPTRLNIQRDARNEDWAARFRQELAQRDVLAGLYPAKRSGARTALDLAVSLGRTRSPVRQFDL